MDERRSPEQDITQRPFDPEMTEADEANTPNEPGAEQGGGQPPPRTEGDEVGI